MKPLVATLALLLAMSCGSSAPAPASAPQPATATQEGATCETAIKIDAANESAGIKAEYAWIAKHYPGSRRGGQALMQCNGKAADRIDFTDANGNKVAVYFDISGWLGKY